MKKNIYIVKKGDSLWKIAQNRGTTVPELLALNPDIHDADTIYPGQEIKLPVRPSPVSPPLPPLKDRSSSTVWWIAGLVAIGTALLALFAF